MIEFLKRLFGQQGSSATAKERLRLVLMTDHLELAPEMIDTMKRELVDVISRYVEVDREPPKRKDATPAAAAKAGGAAPPVRKRRRRKKAASGAPSPAPAAS
jgi:cell division topological specificity factor MinE